MTLALIACAATALAQGLRRPQRKSSSQMARLGASAAQKRQSCVTTTNGVEWTYEVADGAIVLGGKAMKTAVPENTSGALTIPATINGLPVRGIGADAFCSCSNLTSVTIPFGVTNIGETAFFECSGLVSVTIPSSVTRIECSAFSECRSLKSITIPPSVTSIEEGMFVGCGGLESVIISPSVTSIEEGSFQSCSGLTSVTIPSAVTNIEHLAFSFCSGVKAFCVDEANPWYSSRGGMLCSKDGTVLVAGVNGDVEIPSGVERIARRAFWGYEGVTSVTIPSCVTNIGSLAFDFCDGLTNVVVAGDNSFYSAEEGVLYNKTKTELIRCWVSKKSEVIVPSSVVNIGSWAFNGCDELVAVTIPASVKSIGRGAFWNCRKLAKVMMCGERPASQDSIFHAGGRLRTIHVPAHCKSWAGMSHWQKIPLVFVDNLKDVAGKDPAVQK